MKSKRILISNLPNNPWVYLPVYFLVDEIIVPDTSLIDGVDKLFAVDKFCKWLSLFGLDRKIEQHDKFKHDKLIWKVNSLSPKLMKRKVEGISQQKNIKYYFANYLSHRRLSLLSKRLFIRKLGEQISDKQKVVIYKDGDYYILKSLVSFLQLLSGLVIFMFLPILLLIILIRIVLKKICVVYSKTKQFHGGVAVDLMSDITLDNDGYNYPGNYSDTFFCTSDDQFSIKHHAFLDYGWFNKDFKTMESKFLKKGAKVFGIRSFKPKLDFRVLINLIATDLMYLFKLITDKVSYLKLSNQLMLIRFLSNLFEAQICFAQIRPSVYFSRLDYSYLHHVLGAVCHDMGIHFAGICHSPGGDAGHTNQLSLLSFDTYFIYHPIFANVFYPTWKNSITKLVPIGVWRSDFMIQVKKLDSISENFDTRKHLKNRFIVGLHLPVPQSYWFNKKSVTKCVEDYASLISTHKDVAFILFPRRLHEAPDYFIKQIDSLLIHRRCEISSQLQPKRKQTYSWYKDLDMVVGCNYSDVVFEALSCQIPAVSYSNIGEEVSQLWKFDSSLTVYNFHDLSNSIDLARKNLWPSADQWKNINQKLVGKADGNCIARIKSNLLPFIEDLETLRS
jgi:hypothetical protein